MSILASLVDEVNHLHWSIAGLARRATVPSDHPTTRSTMLAILVAAIIVLVWAMRSMTHGRGGVADALRAVMVGAFAMVVVLALLVGAAFVIVR